MPRGIGKNRMRLVKRPRLSGPALTLLEESGEHVNCEGSKKERMVGCVILSVFADGRCNKTIHRPMGDGMPDTMFYAITREGLNHIVNRKIAEDVACDKINEVRND